MLRWLTLSLLVIGADQLTKIAAEAELQLHEAVPVMPFFNLMLAYNEGAAFSFLSDAGGWQRWLFSGLAVVISLVITFWLRRLSPAERLTGFGLALILGGAIGNLIDRLAYGHVIDFIQLYYDRWYWPAFNLADSAITVGVVLLLIDGLVTKQPA